MSFAALTSAVGRGGSVEADSVECQDWGLRIKVLGLRFRDWGVPGRLRVFVNCVVRFFSGSLGFLARRRRDAEAGTSWKACPYFRALDIGYSVLDIGY